MQLEFFALLGEEVPPELLVPLVTVPPVVDPCTDPQQKMHLKRPPKDSLAPWPLLKSLLERTTAFASLPETVASGGLSSVSTIKS